MKKLVVMVCLLLPLTIMYSGGFDEIDITTSSTEARVLYINAREFAESMEFGKAILLINKALKMDPDFALAYLLKARQTTDYSAQEYNLHKAEELCSRISEGEKYLIQYYVGVFRDDTNSQTKYLKKLTDYYPADKRVQFIAASEKFLSGDYKKALEHLVRVIELDPFYSPAYSLLGYCKAGLDKEEGDDSLLNLFTMNSEIPVNCSFL